MSECSYEEMSVMNQIDEGVTIINSAVKALKKPVDKDAMANVKETIGVIKKQYKAMEKDDSIRIQYQDKVAYSTIQLMFQVFHLLILSDVEAEFTDRIIDYIKRNDSVYTLAKRIKAAAEARADFGPVRKGAM
jgi:hypothetical protein